MGTAMANARKTKDKDAFIAAMYRLDPDKLRQLRRITSGVSRCPECDAVNPASERLCVKCGAKLYPVEEAEEARFRRKGEGTR
jgi:uncharacterized paraquat-inducible protein A